MHHWIASRAFAHYLSCSRDDLNYRLSQTCEERSPQMISRGMSTSSRENQGAVLTHTSWGAAPPTSLGSLLEITTFEQSYYTSGKQTRILISRPTCASVRGLCCQTSGEGVKEKQQGKMQEGRNGWNTRFTTRRELAILAQIKVRRTKVTWLWPQQRP